jgi:flagellar hook protein FlgE
MSFQQGLSGLNATSKNLEVIGNNIANASTFGAKSSRAEFSDVYANALNGAGSNPIGIGVSMTAVSQQFTQGNITTTDNPMDLALNGAGFFQVSDGVSPPQYTRNGQFKIDRDGYLINNQNLRLLGYPADGTGTIQPGQASPLRLPTAGINPVATSAITLEMNLDSRLGTTLPAAGDRIQFNDPTTYNNATSMTAYDAKGQDISLTYYFQKAGTDSWNLYATANGVSVTGTDANGPLPLTTVTFPADGSAPTAPLGTVQIDLTGTIVNSSGAEIVTPMSMQLDVSGATQFGTQFGVTDLSQDGYAPGQLVGITIENNGIVTARYSNGQSKPAGQIEIANFRNPQGLQPLGGNGWAATFTSGDPIKGVPGDGNLGVLQAGALEESNVDLTGELVSMITAQRVYQANAQTIKTQDAVMQTLVNLR